MAGKYRRKKKERVDTRAVRVSSSVLAWIEEFAERKKVSVTVAVDVLLQEALQRRRELESLDLGGS